MNTLRNIIVNTAKLRMMLYTLFIKTDFVESSMKVYWNDGANSSHHNFNGTINTINVDRLHKYRFSFMHIFWPLLFPDTHSHTLDIVHFLNQHAKISLDI